MKHPSSIFSFKTLKINNAGALILDAVLVILLISAVDVAFRMTGLTEKFLVEHPKSETGLLVYLEKRLPANPEIVFFGDSISRYAVLPRMLAEQLGLPAEKVANLAITSGTPYDAFKIYMRNRDKLAGARYIFYSINEYQFNERWHEKNVTNRWRYLLDYHDIRYLSGNRNAFSFAVSILLSYLRLYRDSYIFTYYINNPRRIFHDIPQTIREDPRTGFLQIRDEENPTFPKNEEFVADSHMEKFRFSERMMRYLTALDDLCRQNGQKLIIVEIPLKKRYRNYIEKNYPRELSLYQRRIREFLDRRDVTLISSGDILRNVAFSDSDYIDYGHLTRAGAEKATRFLADYLQGTAAVLPAKE